MAKQNGDGTANSRTVKVSRTVHDRLTQLVADVNAKGWRQLGISRADMPTFSTIIEEALNRFKRKGA